MRVACWIPKATNTDSRYEIFIDFPLQQWSHERASILRYMYIACLDYKLPQFISGHTLVFKSNFNQFRRPDSAQNLDVYSPVNFCSKAVCTSNFKIC